MLAAEAGVSLASAIRNAIVWTADRSTQIRQWALLTPNHPSSAFRANGSSDVRRHYSCCSARSHLYAHRVVTSPIFSLRRESRRPNRYPQRYGCRLPPGPQFITKACCFRLRAILAYAAISGNRVIQLTNAGRIPAPRDLGRYRRAGVTVAASLSPESFRWRDHPLACKCSGCVEGTVGSSTGMPPRKDPSRLGGRRLRLLLFSW